MLAGEMDSSLDRRVHNAMHGWIRQPHLHASFLVARCEGEYGTINSASSSSPSSQKASHHCLLSTLPLELPVPHSTPNTLLSSDDSLDDSFPASSSALSAPVSSSALVPGTALTQAYLQNHQRSLPSQTMHADLPCLAASIFEKNAASSVYGEERAREWDSLQGEKSLREIQASKHAFVSALISEAFATVQDTKPTSSASSATSSSIFLGMGDAYKSKSAVNSAFTRRTVFAQETGDMQVGGWCCSVPCSCVWNRVWVWVWVAVAVAVWVRRGSGRFLTMECEVCMHGSFTDARR